VDEVPPLEALADPVERKSVELPRRLDVGFRVARKSRAAQEGHRTGEKRSYADERT
jgi:hypothetical protein